MTKGGILKENKTRDEVRDKLSEALMKVKTSTFIEPAYAVMSLSEGINGKIILENLGHHSTAFTMEVYVHTTHEMKKDAAEKAGNVLKFCIKNGNSPSKGAID